MNVKRKKDAVKKYNAMREEGATYKAIRAAMKDMEYKPEEVVEVIEAIQLDRGEEDEKVKPALPKNEAPKRNTEAGPGYPHMYELWDVRYDSATKQWVKREKLRSNIKITEGEADSWNGNFEPSSTNPRMYFEQGE